MKKFTLFAALCSLTLFSVGCDNSPAAKNAREEKREVNAEARDMKDEINAEAKDETADVNEAAKEADKEIDAEKKAEEADSK